MALLETERSRLKVQLRKERARRLQVEAEIVSLQHKLGLQPRASLLKQPLPHKAAPTHVPCISAPTRSMQQTTTTLEFATQSPTTTTSTTIGHSFAQVPNSSSFPPNTCSLNANALQRHDRTHHLAHGKPGNARHESCGEAEQELLMWKRKVEHAESQRQNVEIPTKLEYCGSEQALRGAQESHRLAEATKRQHLDNFRFGPDWHEL
eukprot:GEMP01060804.1.p1 GENE.GEMP01060804.1~~GEMP01060804.1.p1  ORF type:complete len:207 (+),score=51.45 GEMP01060804.1:152-772(+)